MSDPALRREDSWSYQAIPGHYDETRTIDGERRAHWRQLFERFAALGTDEMARRWRDGQRLIHENGVTYNVYGDPLGMDRPWALDPCPLLVPATEWRAIEGAIAQRAQLLNAVLADLYGAQRLLLDGLLPPEIVFAHPGFLRPLHGVSVPNGVYLHVYAADLARSLDGRWWVITDRAQAPSGAGYTLENRVVMQRILPDEFTEYRVHRLAAYFRAYHGSLESLARSDSPRIVLLTPGPYNESYFEHAYLARYLGYPLVQGGDLTTRDDRVYLRTLSGLLPVDVILRRQDDAYCDPLELRGDSQLGVAGLVGAVRAGNVVVANALGSGLVETPALTSFLTALAPRLVGEELRMPSLATWWCGDADARAYVLDHLDSLVIKPTFPRGRIEPIFGRDLDAAGRARLSEAVRARPRDFVAQEQVALSVAPAWSESGFAPRPLTLRVYAVAVDGSYRVMPGGLTRISNSAQSILVSLQHGGGSKDTWVLTDAEEEELYVPHRQRGPGDADQWQGALSSRVADDLYWMGRYLERADAEARIQRRAMAGLLDADSAREAWETPPALRVALAAGALRAPAGGFAGPVALRNELLAAGFAAERPESLRSTVRYLHRIASHNRDRISLDAWRIVNRMARALNFAPDPAALRLGDAIEHLERLIDDLLAIRGLVMESMTRDLGWYLLDLGRRLERAKQGLRLLRAALARPSAHEADLLEVLLDIFDSAITYRRRYQTAPDAGLVLRLVLFDESNPRSVAHQLAELTGDTRRLPGGDAAANLAAQLHEHVRGSAALDLASADAAGQRGRLVDLLSHASAQLDALGAEIERSHFTLATPISPL